MGLRQWLADDRAYRAERRARREAAPQRISYVKIGVAVFLAIWIALALASAARAEPRLSVQRAERVVARWEGNQSFDITKRRRANGRVIHLHVQEHGGRADAAWDLDTTMTVKLHAGRVRIWDSLAGWLN